MSDEIRTYAEAAKWLPTDVREHIEATTPCRNGGRHDWGSCVESVFHTFGRETPICVDARWTCSTCFTVVHSDPKGWA